MTSANCPAAGNPGNVKVAQSGDFVMAVKIGNDTITKVPFSLKEETSGISKNALRETV
jgi:hypothetical protein